MEAAPAVLTGPGAPQAPEEAVLVPPPVPSLFQLYFVMKQAHAFSPSLLAPLRLWLKTSPFQPSSPPPGTQNRTSPKKFPVKPVGKPGTKMTPGQTWLASARPTSRGLRQPPLPGWGRAKGGKAAPPVPTHGREEEAAGRTAALAGAAAEPEQLL